MGPGLIETYLAEHENAVLTGVEDITTANDYYNVITKDASTQLANDVELLPHAKEIIDNSSQTDLSMALSRGIMTETELVEQATAAAFAALANNLHAAMASIGHVIPEAENEVDDFDKDVCYDGAEIVAQCWSDTALYEQLDVLRGEYMQTQMQLENMKFAMDALIALDSQHSQGAELVPIPLPTAGDLDEGHCADYEEWLHRKRMIKRYLPWCSENGVITHAEALAAFSDFVLSVRGKPSVACKSIDDIFGEELCLSFRVFIDRFCGE